MAKFVFQYRGGASPETLTAEQQEQSMAAWMAWFGEMGDAVADPGNPFGAQKTIDSDLTVTDGGGANPTTGYTVVEAADIDAAVNLAKGCPIYGEGGSITVAEAIPM